MCRSGTAGVDTAVAALIITELSSKCDHHHILVDPGQE
jgi:hypothetical protein